MAHNLYTFDTEYRINQFIKHCFLQVYEFMYMYIDKIKDSGSRTTIM